MPVRYGTREEEAVLCREWEGRLVEELASVRAVMAGLGEVGVSTAVNSEGGWERTTQDGAPLPEPVEVPLSARHRAMVKVGAVEPDLRRFQMGECTILVGSSRQSGWHLSISAPDRYPTWDEIAKARYVLTPATVTMAMILPPVAEYVNLHPTCLHLYQIDRPRQQ